MLDYIPKFFTKNAIVLYFIALIAVSVLFMGNQTSFIFMLFGMVEVCVFFHFSNQDSIAWKKLSEKAFVNKIFVTALIIRVIYVLFSYYFYTIETGKPFEYGTADSYGYHETASDFVNIGWNYFVNYIKSSTGVSDLGYPTYLSVIYWLTDDSIMVARLLKALYSAIACVLIYKIASRHFGYSTGRMAAVMCVFMPHLIYYCGMHLKETEMVFITVAFMERADYLLVSKKFNFGNILVAILLAGSLFFFRTVLGAAALFSLITALMLSPSKMVGKKKKLLVGSWVVIAVVFFMGGSIMSEVMEIWEKKESQQEISMEWRSEREGGNKFAKYAGAAVFAPLIFTIPFPTMIDPGGIQQDQQMINGNNFVKNIISFFTILGIFLLVFRKQWREHILLLSFVVGYIGILVFSEFAQSERFHLPTIPFVLIFAAYGMSQMTNKYKRYYTYWLIFIFVAVIGWNWFKLAGRGLV
ncbi:MAG: hypothetical protein EOL95_04870 [Bacteroidia bacterium]|nr:hypothetical protein [Bacteroidia bacterium]